MPDKKRFEILIEATGQIEIKVRATEKEYNSFLANPDLWVAHQAEQLELRIPEIYPRLESAYFAHTGHRVKLL